MLYIIHHEVRYILYVHTLRHSILLRDSAVLSRPMADSTKATTQVPRRSARHSIQPDTPYAVHLHYNVRKTHSCKHLLVADTRRQCLTVSI